MVEDPLFGVQFFYKPKFWCRVTSKISKFHVNNTQSHINRQYKTIAIQADRCFKSFVTRFPVKPRHAKKLGCNRFKASPGHAKKHKHFTTRCCLQVRQFTLTKLVASTQGSQFILAQKKLARKKATTSRPVEVTSYVSHGQRQSTERTFEHSKRKNVLYSFLLLLT